MNIDDHDSWINAVGSNPCDIADIRNYLGISASLQLSSDDVESHGLIHDPEALHTMGETNYQKWFNEQNINNNRNNYILRTQHVNSRIPVALQPENEVFRFTGKTDNLSMLRPLAIEFKGNKYPANHRSSGKLIAMHFEVIEQAIRRIYSMSCIQQFIGNIGVFAVCHDRVWLVWYKRTIDPEEGKQSESIHVMTIDPGDFRFLWALLTKEALADRNVIFVEGNNDFYYLIQFLNYIYPNIAYYCRTKFVSMSNNSVYAVTLPQLTGRKSTSTMCVSKVDKHFALKVVSSQSYFEREVDCIARINSYIDDKNVQEASKFYAFGSKAWNGDYISHAFSPPIDFTKLKKPLNHVVSNESMDFGSDLQPWWLFEPAPRQPLEGGVIVMRCGDYSKHAKAYDNVVEPMIFGVQFWLNLYHQAQVLHRDIRLPNIMRFDDPPVYTAIVDRNSNETSRNNGNRNSCLQWQLIDFSIGHCLKKDEESVMTQLHINSAQYQNAGWMVKEINNQEQFEYEWTYFDDQQMMMNVFVKFLKGRNTGST
jgi:hypothetical protein